MTSSGLEWPQATCFCIMWLSWIAARETDYASSWKGGNQWTLLKNLEELDTLALISITPSQEHVRQQDNVNFLGEVSQHIGLKIHEKTKIMHTRGWQEAPITIKGSTVEKVGEFTWEPKSARFGTRRGLVVNNECQTFAILSRWKIFGPKWNVWVLNLNVKSVFQKALDLHQKVSIADSPIEVEWQEWQTLVLQKRINQEPTHMKTRIKICPWVQHSLRKYYWYEGVVAWISWRLLDWNCKTANT